VSTTKHTNYTKKGKSRKKLEDDALGFDFGVRAKIYQETEFVARRMQVIEDLGAMLRGKLHHGLDFHDDLLETDEKGLVLQGCVDRVRSGRGPRGELIGVGLAGTKAARRRRSLRR
jgi:hypothetical protein